MSCGGFFSVDSLRGVWILVVDGNPRGREILVEILSYCGALVTPMASADEALSVMRQVKPDVLIVAVPDDDDFEFIDPEQSRARGFQAHLRAPLDPWELCRLVSSLMTVRS